MKKKVLFFFPAFSSQEATAPLAILALSTPLQRAGYEVRIIDSTITPNFQQQVIKELEDSLCLAVSLVTGPMIRETAQIAKAAKAIYPTKPVILGGWHPSLLPDQTLACPDVDAIVIGQGEEALVEMVRHIEAGESFKGIPGVAYKEDGRLAFNSPRALKPIRELPPKAYHLADFDAYERVCGRRWAMYTSSLACPYNCAYCTNEGLNPELLWLADDVFTIHHGWLFEFAAEMKRKKIAVPFECITRADRVNEAVAETLAELRCFRVWIGSESGSQRILDAMQRGVTIQQVRSAVHLCKSRGIQTGMFLMWGYDGEEIEDIEETVAHAKVCQPDVCFTTVSYPIKGTPYYDRISSRLVTLGDWTTSTDRDIRIQGRHSRRFYQYADDLLKSELAPTPDVQRTAAARAGLQMTRDEVEA